MTEHAVNNGTSICQTAQATHLILTFQDFCAAKTVGFTYAGQRAELEFHLVSDPEPDEIQLLLYVRNISSNLWHILTYEDPFNNMTDTDGKVLAPNEDVYLYPIREFSFRNRDELIIYFHFDHEAEMLQSPEIDQEQLEQLWRRLQSLVQDSAFADMTVNGLPAHRAVLAATSGPLQETISNLIFNNQSSTSEDLMICDKSSEHSNVDNENGNTKPIEEGYETDNLKQCNNENTVDVKTNNDGPPDDNRNNDDQPSDFEKIIEDAKESSVESNIQNSANSLNHENESTSALKNYGEIISDKNSKSVGTVPSEVTKNSALITNKTVEDIKKSRRTEDKIITHDVLLHLLDLPVNSMVNNFLTEHVDEHEQDFKMLERPLPGNYQLEMTELCNNTSEKFLKYIYTNFVCVDNEIQTIRGLLAVARLFDLENLKTDVELQISSNHSHTELRSEILNLVKLYDLHIAKLKIISFIRWNFDYFSASPFIKYLLTMPPHHKYQKQCSLTLKLPNISKLNEYVYCDSNVFFICGFSLQVSVFLDGIGTDNRLLRIKILRDKNNVDMPILCRAVLISTTSRNTIQIYSIRNTRYFELDEKEEDEEDEYNEEEEETWYSILEWEELTDPANGYIMDDSIELQFYVKLDDSWQIE